MSDSQRTNRAVLAATLLAAAIPPAAGAYFLQNVYRNNPAILIAGIIAWEAGLLLWIFLSKVMDKLQERWSDRFVDVIDQWLIRTFSRYGRKYHRYLRELYLDMDLKGLPLRGIYSLAADQVFVDISLFPQSIHEIPSGLLEGGEPQTDRFLRGTRLHVWELLHRHDKRPDPLAILGPPGSGKTTLLKYMTLTMLHRGRKSRRLGAPRAKMPILLFLREHTKSIIQNGDSTLADLVRSSLTSSPAAVDPPRWFEKQLGRGRCVVLLDGLDEVVEPEHRRQVVDWVDRQIATYPDNNFVVTSRPHGYKSYPVSRATSARVRPFTEHQIELFVNQWYSATEQRRAGRADAGVTFRAQDGAKDLMRRLRSNSNLHTLAMNPLLLTMIAHVHYYRGALPGTRADLYREICQVLLGRRQDAKRISSDLSLDQKEYVIQHLAFEMMKRRKVRVAADEAATIIAPHLKRMSIRLSTRDFLQIIRDECGLLLERETGIYAFPHLTFQEFLCSRYISEKKMESVLVEGVTDPWWRETTLLYVAQQGADAVVEACLAKAPSQAALELAVGCSDEARELSPELRAKLEEALSSNAAGGNTESRAMAATVILGRTMREAVRVNEDTWLSRSPISIREYDFCLHRPSDLTPKFDPQRPALINSETEVQQFIRWASGIVGEVRLPTSTEVSAAVSDDLLNISESAIWTSGPGKTLTLFADHLPPINDFEQRARDQLRQDAVAFLRFLAHEEEAGAETQNQQVLYAIERNIPRRLLALVSLATCLDFRNPPAGMKFLLDKSQLTLTAFDATLGKTITASVYYDDWRGNSLDMIGRDLPCLPSFVYPTQRNAVSAEQVFKKAETLIRERGGRREEAQGPGMLRLVAATTGILRGFASDKNSDESVPQKTKKNQKSEEFDSTNMDHLLLIARVASAAATLELQLAEQSHAPISPSLIRLLNRRIFPSKVRRGSNWHPTLAHLTSELCVLEWRRRGELPVNEVVHLARN
ncbi:NACHT domain-containing protein [Verrucosispora sp. TAA-831]|uniref:NACHT domain-containing protein n=1 Tax=Verrucosispora sp. TAA-831 TaxID=3422227 RepID=UPI003D6DD9C5